MIEKEFGKKRLIQTGIIFGVPWLYFIYRVVFMPESLSDNRFRLGFYIGVYLSPFLFFLTTYLEWQAAKKKSKNNSDKIMSLLHDDKDESIRILFLDKSTKWRIVSPELSRC